MYVCAVELARKQKLFKRRRWNCWKVKEEEEKGEERREDCRER